MNFTGAQIAQIAITIVGAGVAAYVAVTAKIHRVELAIKELQLKQAKTCEEHRDKLERQIARKADKPHATTNPGLPASTGNPDPRL